MTANRFLLLPAGSLLFVSVHMSESEIGNRINRDGKKI